MPPNNCDPAAALLDPAPGESACPRCGVQMESIASGVEGPPFHELQLCPGCYLVMWHDEDGFQIRQGAPMRAQRVRSAPPDVT
jgi:hypothetical protein